jgi:hypothetical protein
MKTTELIAKSLENDAVEYIVESPENIKKAGTT